MSISAYYVQNILKVYHSQLKAERTYVADREPDLSPGTVEDRVTISAEGKKQQILREVAAQAVERLMRDSAQGAPAEAAPSATAQG
ncbi:MAG: hypothetical protein HYV08_10745 [Deltaproteobacteria bacterium]|nr:hypothetical protein [Deltaproteobacteria bacterium]MBI3079047.1 hypothetical protein [Deltaproteobacteria bacterium]